MRIVLNVLPWAAVFAAAWLHDRFATLNRWADSLPGNRPGLPAWRTWIHHRIFVIFGGLVGAAQSLPQPEIPWQLGMAVGVTVVVAFYAVREWDQWRQHSRQNRPGKWVWSWPRVGWGWDGLLDVPAECLAVWAVV